MKCIIFLILLFILGQGCNSNQPNFQNDINAKIYYVDIPPNFDTVSFEATIKIDTTKTIHILKFPNGGTETNVRIYNENYLNHINRNTIVNINPLIKGDFTLDQDVLLDISTLASGQYYVHYLSCNVGEIFPLNITITELVENNTETTQANEYQNIGILPIELINAIQSKSNDTISNELTKMIYSIIAPDEKIKFNQQAIIYSKEVNLDNDIEKEIVFSISTGFDNKYICWVDLIENQYFLTNQKWFEEYEINEFPFEIIDKNKITIAVNRDSWGDNGYSTNFHFYKHTGQEIYECLNLIQYSAIGYYYDGEGVSSVCEATYASFRDTLIVTYDYSIGVITSLIEPKDKILSEKEFIKLIANKEDVVYIWHKDSLKYKPKFDKTNKLNELKIRGLRHDGMYPVFDAFKNDFDKLRISGNIHQKRYIKNYLDKTWYKQNY